VINSLFRKTPTQPNDVALRGTAANTQLGCTIADSKYAGVPTANDSITWNSMFEPRKMRILCKSPSNKILSFPRTPTPVRELQTRAWSLAPSMPCCDAKRLIDSLGNSLPEYSMCPPQSARSSNLGPSVTPFPLRPPLIRMTSPCLSALETWWPPQGMSQNTLQSQKGMRTQVPSTDRITRPQKGKPPKERLKLGNYVVERADNDRKRQSQKTTRTKGKVINPRTHAPPTLSLMQEQPYTLQGP